ncbi:VWA domain-containing protein [Thioalkalivibrio sp. AKL19]|uniref:VWA domain-containing protein n=1 Tax=Thioalkalivibrio sp. AKL19 TaxID=1266914 RepID=UPI0004625523|nr:VWA domain-containing protein [Thioalkalivibrio sp. AKL19]
MTLEYGKSRLLVPALLAASLGLSGCGGGGGGDAGGGGGGGNTPETGITVVPERFDFGIMTEGNEDHVLPRQFIIRNEGATSHNISSINLFGRDPRQFRLDDSGGNAPCGAPPFDLPAGGSCTVEVEFEPRSFSTPEDPFEALLIAQSDNPNTPAVGGTVAGTYEPVDEIFVTVNQVNACALNGPQAFVSVTDQGGFPISNLRTEAFTLVELGSGELKVDHVGHVADIGLSLSIAMDYSGSITDLPDAVDNMEAGATLLVNEMKANDDADIIKYANEVKPMTEYFTSDQDILQDAIDDPPGLDRDTAFYAATEEAIERFGTKKSTHDRKAVITLTDGEDTFVDDTEAARKAALDATIDQALGADIPVFTIGFGPFIQIAELQRLADETGGLFYEPPGDANLQQVFQQLASLLFEDQYVIDFSGLSDNEGSSLEVAVAYDDKYNETRAGEGIKPIQACQQ